MGPAETERWPGCLSQRFQYRDFVDWQRAWPQTPAAKEQLDYWRAQLEGVTALPLRTDRPRPEVWSGRGARHSFKFSRGSVAEHRGARPRPKRHAFHDAARGVPVPAVPLHRP